MSSSIKESFKEMGARVKVREPRLQSPRQRWSGGTPAADFVSLDVRTDKKGTFFDILSGPKVGITVLDVQPDRRYLLLMTESPHDGKSKFLCGHDERDWFIAAIPESKPASNVDTAIEALKPDAVKAAEAKTKIKRKNRNRRKNEAWVRQGEWFFIPHADLQVDPIYILYNEPLRRGAGKPHMCQELYRTGGQTVYVSRHFPNGLTEAAYKQLDKKERGEKGPFRVMRRDPTVYVRGRVRHSDHKTVILPYWHEVQMNTETKARAMRRVAFLD